MWSVAVKPDRELLQVTLELAEGSGVDETPQELFLQRADEPLDQGNAAVLADGTVADGRDQHPHETGCAVPRVADNGSRRGLQELTVRLDPLGIIDMQKPAACAPQALFRRAVSGNREAGRLLQVRPAPCAGVNVLECEARVLEKRTEGSTPLAGESAFLEEALAASDNPPKPLARQEEDSTYDEDPTSGESASPDEEEQPPEP